MYPEQIYPVNQHKQSPRHRPASSKCEFLTKFTLPFKSIANDLATPFVCLSWWLGPLWLVVQQINQKASNQSIDQNSRWLIFTDWLIIAALLHVNLENNIKWTAYTQFLQKQYDHNDF